MSSRPPRSRVGRRGSLAASERSPSLGPSSAASSPAPLNGFSLSTDSDRDDATPPHAQAAAAAGRVKSGGKERQRDRVKDLKPDKDTHQPHRAEKLALKAKESPSSSPAPPSSSSAVPSHPPSSNGSSKGRGHDLLPGTSLKRKTSASPSGLLTSSAKAAKTSASSTASKAARDTSLKGGVAAFEVYTPAFDPVTGESLFCVCRRPNDGEAMICCDVCEEWYHLRCIGLSAQEAARLEHFVCARCKLDPVRGKEENRKRKRAEEERKSGAAVGGKLSNATGERRIRRREKNGVEERDAREDDERPGDGTGKWIKKDAVVLSESEDDTFVYMTSDDEELAASAAEPIKLEAGATLPSPSSPTLPATSSRPHHHKQPRTVHLSPSFARPDHRLNPLIRHTPHTPRPLYPSSSALQALSRRASTSLHGLFHHPYYVQAHSTESALLPSALFRWVQRLANRWASLQEEYEDEEEKRQQQLSGEEWRLQQLVLSYRIPPSEGLTVDDSSLAPQPSPLDLLLGSALPLGLGHPRLLRDAQLVVTSANDFSSSVDAFHSHPQTPSASFAAPSSHPSVASRAAFRFTSAKRQAADCVAIEIVYCVGCEGWVPLSDYAQHVEDCCMGPMTTPDQRLMVLLPYEEGMEEQARPQLMLGRQWTQDDQRQGDAGVHQSAAAQEQQSDKLHALQGHAAAPKPPFTPPLKNGTLESHTAPHTPSSAITVSAAIATPPQLTSAASAIPFTIGSPSDPATSLPSAGVAVQEPMLTAPALSACPSLPGVTRFHRFLNPALFPDLLCGHPLLCGLPSSPSHTHCRELRLQCPDHAGWEEKWRDARRRRRRELAGRMQSLREDMEDLAAFMDERWKRTSDTASGPTRDSALPNGRAHADAYDEAMGDSDSTSKGNEDERDDSGHAEVDKRRNGRGASMSSSSDSPSSSSPSSLLARSPGGLLSGSLATKKEKDRERVRERERLNKQRQRERAKAREREKEARAREKERSREKKRERKRKRREERERKERRKEHRKDKKRRHGPQQTTATAAGGGAAVGGSGGGGGGGGSARRDRRAASDSDSDDASVSSASSDSDPTSTFSP